MSRNLRKEDARRGVKRNEERERGVERLEGRPWDKDIKGQEGKRTRDDCRPRDSNFHSPSQLVHGGLLLPLLLMLLAFVCTNQRTVSRSL